MKKNNSNYSDVKPPENPAMPYLKPNALRSHAPHTPDLKRSFYDAEQTDHTFCTFSYTDCIYNRKT